VHLGESSMSIFSRLFNKGQDPEAKPADQASTGQAGHPGAQDPSQPLPGSVPSYDAEVLGTFATEDGDDDIELTRQQERPDLVFESARLEPKPKKNKEPAMEPPKPPKAQQPSGTPPRGGAAPMKASVPPPLPKKDAGLPRTDTLRPAYAPPPAEQAGQAGQPAGQAAVTVPAGVPPLGQRGRPVADLGRLFDGGDVLETLERALIEEDAPTGIAQTTTEPSEVRNLFNELGGNYMLPVRDFMFDVKSGEARVDWLHTCESSVRSLRGVAEGLGLDKLAHALGKFGEVLKAADDSQVPTIRGEMRDQLLAAYFNLIDLMPLAFGLDAERQRRETIIINTLLLQIPGVQRNSVDRMHAAGLSTLETIVGARSDEIAAATGLPMETATRIVDKLQAHRKDLEAGSLAGLPPPPAPQGFGAPPMPGTRGHHTASPSTLESQQELADAASIDVLLDDGGPDFATSPQPVVKLLPPSADRDLIESLVAELKAQRSEFASVADGWNEAATSRRRELRKLRAEALQKVKMVLIRLGETEAVSEIDKLSFEHKLERIERYLRA
jgi:hypothetical protein